MCEKDLYPTIGLAALNAGGPIGVYIFGILNDRSSSYNNYLADFLLTVDFEKKKN